MTTTTHGGNTLEWSKGTGKKKYRVKITFKDGKKKTVQFGHQDYEQYKDSTPLKLYDHKDHNDITRRDKYRARHGKQGYQNKIYSPAWFAWNYLW